MSVKREEKPFGFSSLFQEILQHGGAFRPSEFPQGLRLNLPDPLAGQVEFPADFIQRQGILALQPVPQDQHFRF